MIAPVHVFESRHRHVAGFAINAGLFPDGVITVGAEIIIGCEPAKCSNSATTKQNRQRS